MAASPRSDIVNPHEIGVYHCWTRCVRRTRLCGVDPLTGKDFSYRRDWIISFQQECATLFAIELAFHAILANHNHNIIRNRPDIAATWTPEEVVRRWLTITHLVKSKDGKPQEFTEEDIAAEMSDPERVEELRVRLADPSVYMASINEHIARRCNREDGVTGHFWEGRFECRNLVDEAAILVCGIYVDLNQIRAGEATTPENSQYTSAYCRIQAFQQQQQEASPTVAEADADAAAADA
ncbi:MAG: hypothetical protein KDA60_17880, partial [Planctomycetales bacterium]|nr:hypothetical protein [Planctomycetales bacterium]